MRPPHLASRLRRQAHAAQGVLISRIRAQRIHSRIGFEKKMRSTKEVLDHHVRCFGESDIAGILSDYAPNAIMFTPEGPLKGVAAIRPFFQAMCKEFGRPSTAFSMKHQ